MKFGLSLIIFLTLSMTDFAEIVSAEIDNFEELAKAYANKEAKKCNTKVKFVDLYAKHKPEMKDEYNKYKIDVKFEDMIYNTKEKKTTDRENGVYTAVFYNGDPSNNRTNQFIKELELKKSFTWKVTSKVNVQDKLEVEVSLPKIVPASRTLRAKLNMSGEAEKIEVSNETVNSSIIIEPKTRVKVTLIQTEREMIIPWSADIVITGHFAFWLDKKCAINSDKKDKHYLWFPSVASLENDKFRWDPSRGLIYETKGTFRSVINTKTALSVKVFDFNPKTKLEKRSETEKPKKEYRIEL